MDYVQVLQQVFEILCPKTNIKTYHNLDANNL